jgi:hypothetical protein
MTVREYFAGKALQGLSANADFRFECATSESVAKRAASLADALLKELARK